MFHKLLFPVLGLFLFHEYAVSQTILKKTHPAKYAYYTKQGKLILIGDQLTIFDTNQKQIFTKSNPTGAQIQSVNFDQENSRVHILLKVKVADAYQEIASELNITNNTYTPIDLSKYNAPEESNLRYSPDYSYSYVDGSKNSQVFNSNQEVILEVNMNYPIRTIDINPYVDDIAIAADKNSLRIINTSSLKYYEIPFTYVKAAYYVDDTNLLVWSRQFIRTFNPRSISEERFKIEDVDQFLISPDRRTFCVLKEDRTEIWSIDAEIKNVSTRITLSQNASELLKNLSQEESEVYVVNKEIIDEELDLKAYLFKERGEFEKSADYELRLDKGRKYFNDIIGYYLGIKNARKNLESRILQLQKDFETQKKQLIRSVEDSLAKVDSERKQSLTAEKVRKSYKEFITSISSLDSYNADAELYKVIIDNRKAYFKITPEKARLFKSEFGKYIVVGAKQLDSNLKEEIILGYNAVSPEGEVLKSNSYLTPSNLPDEDEDNLLAQTILEITKPKEQPAQQRSLQKVSEFVYEKIKSVQYHALIIGVNDYASETVNDLANPIGDGLKLAAVLKEKYNFKSENITFLENPTRTEIIESFDNYAQVMTKEDNLLIFYAGHGMWDKTLKQGYWLPSDAKSNSKVAWLSNSTIRDYITGIQSKHTLLIADACFSGGIFKTREVFLDEAVGFAKIYNLQSRKAITSGNMTPVEDQSPFMYYLIKRLLENDEPLISAEQLYISLKIPVANNNITGQVPQFGDILNSGDEGGDFIFVQNLE